MAVLNDYKCPEHGYFEAMEAVCPYGCKNVMVVFLQAPGLKSDRTKNTDKTLNTLAKDYKMTDIKSTREGESQSGYLTRNNKETRPGDSAIWGNFNGMDANSLIKSNLYAGQGINLKEQGLKEIKPASYIQDHENLKVKMDDNS